MKKKSPSLSVLGQGIQDTLRDFADSQFFDTRKELNEEKVAYLHLEDKLQNDIKIIRKKFKIPKLKPEDDVFTFDVSEHSIEGNSSWLFRKSEQIQNDFANEVDQVMVKYSLPKNFYDWIQFYILYNNKPPWKPLYNWDLLEQIMKNLDEPQRIPLTAKEKKFARWSFRWITKSKPGRPKKQHQKAYRELLEALLESKNKKRRFRSLKMSLEIQKTKSGKEEFYSDEKGEWISKNRTYRDVAVNKNPDITEEQVNKTASTIRKKIERLKKRMR